MAATNQRQALRISWALALAVTTAMPSTWADNSIPTTQKPVSRTGLKASAAGSLVIVAPSKPKPAKKLPDRAPRVHHDPNLQAAAHQQSADSQRKDFDSAQVPEMLVHAHQLSQSAATEKDFEEIAVICNTAVNLGAVGDQLEFALQLRVWAVEERDEARIRQIEQRLLAEKSMQQRQALQSEEQLRAEIERQKLRAQKAEQKFEMETLTQKLQTEIDTQKREAEFKQKELQQEIAALKLRAQRAEKILAQQGLTGIAMTELTGSIGSQAVPLPTVEKAAVAGSPASTDSEQQPTSQGPQQITNPAAMVAQLATPIPVAGQVAQGQQANSESITQTQAHQAIDWQSLHDQAVSLAERGNQTAALAKFDQVIKLNNKSAKAYSNRATLHTEMDNLELALKDYQQACAIDDRSLHAQLGLGRTFHQLGKHEEALECMNLAIELDSDNAKLYCTRADLHADIGNYCEALADYAQTIDLNPKFGHAYRNGAWLLATCPDPRFRDPQNAIRGAKQALEFGYGERHIALDTLAAAYAADVQFEAAEETIQEAIQVAPNEVLPVYRERLKMYKNMEPYREEWK